MPKASLKKSLINKFQHNLKEAESQDKELVEDLETLNNIAEETGHSPVIPDESISALKKSLAIERFTSEDKEKLNYLEKYRYLNERTPLPKATTPKSK